MKLKIVILANGLWVEFRAAENVGFFSLVKKFSLGNVIGAELDDTNIKLCPTLETDDNTRNVVTHKFVSNFGCGTACWEKIIFPLFTHTHAQTSHYLL